MASPVLLKMAVSSAVTAAAVAATHQQSPEMKTSEALATFLAIFSASFLSLHALLLLPPYGRMKRGIIDILNPGFQNLSEPKFE